MLTIVLLGNSLESIYHHTNSLGSERILPVENVALLTNFSVNRLADVDRLIFTKHPFSDNSSITIHVRGCNGSLDKEISKCDISRSIHSCSIQQPKLSSEVSVCVFASLHTNSSLPVIEYEMVNAFFPKQSRVIFGISYFLCAVANVMISFGITTIIMRSLLLLNLPPVSQKLLFSFDIVCLPIFVVLLTSLIYINYYIISQIYYKTCYLPIN